MKFKVRYVDEKIQPGNFVGMNWWAAKENGVPYPYSKNTILIYKKLGRIEKKQTLQHEKIEAFLMANRNHKYKTAHEKSNVFEKLDVPFR